MAGELVKEVVHLELDTIATSFRNFSDIAEDNIRHINEKLKDKYLLVKSTGQKVKFLQARRSNDCSGIQIVCNKLRNNGDLAHSYRVFDVKDSQFRELEVLEY